MTEASRVQKLLTEQNAEIDRLKARIEKLEAVNLKQSCIKAEDMARITALEDALRGVIAVADRDAPEFRRARAALAGERP